MSRVVIFFEIGIFLSVSLFMPSVVQAQTLEEALALSYQNNPGLKAEQAKLRAIDEQVSQALSGWRPSIDAVGEVGKTYQKNSEDVVGVPSSANLSPRDVSITVTQPIFRGFRTTSSVRSSEAAVLAQRAVLMDVEQKLLFDSAKTYLDVVLAQQVLGMNKENERVLSQQLEATTDRFRVGELKKTDVSQAELRLSAAKASRAVAEGDLSNKRSAFLRLIGEVPHALSFPQMTYEIPNEMEGALSLVEKNNPSILAANYGVDVADADISTAKGSLLPEVSLVANANRGWNQNTTYPGKQDTASIMARVTVPLYRAGADYSKTRAAYQAKTQKRMELDDVRRKARDNGMTSWQDLMTARAAIAAHKVEVQAAEMALEGVKEESKVGTRTTLDVLNAEQELLNAKINLARSEHDEAIAHLQVMSAIGSLTARNLRLPVTLYNPSENYDDVRNKWVGFGKASD
ncbi:MAG: TolC family outer membrane protein [Bdellovibrionales bacterium]